MLRRALCASATLVFLAVLALACWPGRAAAQEGAHESRQRAEAEPGKAHAEAAAEAAHGGAEPVMRPRRASPIRWSSSPRWPSGRSSSSSASSSFSASSPGSPLVEALHQREEHLEHCLLQTEKARNESEQLLAEHRRLMAQADDRVKALFDKAQKDAQASADEIVKPAQAEAEAARERPSARSPRPATRLWPRSGARPRTSPCRSPGGCFPRNSAPMSIAACSTWPSEELPARPSGGNGQGGSHA